MDKYIPTEEEKKKFGRINAGYSAAKITKVDLTKVHKSVLKDLYNLTNLVSDRSKKKLYDIIWNCWSEENSNPKSAFQYVRDNLKSFPLNEKEKIDRKIKELERQYNVV